MRFGSRLSDRWAGFPLVVVLLCGASEARVVLAGEGDPDTTFSTDGKVVLDLGEYSTAYAVTARADGDLLVAGRVQGPWTVARLQNDGSPDPGWSSVPFDFAADGAYATVSVLAIGNDSLGRTLVAGLAVPDDSFDFYMPAIARLDASGALDPTFDGNGRRFVAAPAGWTHAATLDAVVLPDGRSYFLGNCVGCLLPEKSGPGTFLLRLDANGSPDPTFSSDGWAMYADDLLSVEPRALSVEPDGAATAAFRVSFNSSPLGVVVIRWTTAGELDSSFSGNGIGELVDREPGAPIDLVVNPDTGKIVVGIQVSLQSPGDGLLGLTSQGARDLQFGASGWLDLEIEEGTELAALELQSDGKIVAAATIDANGTQPAGFLVARVLDDGTLDNSYDDNGVNRVEFDLVADGPDVAHASTLSGGRLVVVGSAGRLPAPQSDFAVLRIETALVFADGFERGTAGAWVP